MATSEEVEDLFERSYRSGVLIGEPPAAVVLGIQALKVEQAPGANDFVLRTTSYKYCLLVRSRDAAIGATPTWFALRVESESRVGQNSWLLNHPVHHMQLGVSDDFRILWPRGRSLLSFLDAVLRSFAVSVWSEMYPSLFLHLSEPAGRFASFTRAPPPGSSALELTTPHAEAVKAILRQGRADRVDWHADLEQWRDDVDSQSMCAPELFDVFAEGP